MTLLDGAYFPYPIIPGSSEGPWRSESPSPGHHHEGHMRGTSRSVSVGQKPPRRFGSRLSVKHPPVSCVERPLFSTQCAIHSLAMFGTTYHSEQQEPNHPHARDPVAVMKRCLSLGDAHYHDLEPQVLTQVCTPRIPVWETCMVHLSVPLTLPVVRPPGALWSPIPCNDPGSS